MTTGQPLVRRLAIVTHVVHFDHDGALHAYGPYAREVDRWVPLAEEIRVVAPVRRAPPPPDCAPIAVRRVQLCPQPELGGEGLAPKLAQLVRLPWRLVAIWGALDDVDAIHVRCPGNIGLLGLLVAPLRARRLVAKYAGLWGHFPGEPTSSRLQRVLLRSRWWRGPVLVYGRRDDDPAHIVAAMPAGWDTEHARRAAALAAQRSAVAPVVRPLRLLFVGRLTAAKGAGLLLEALASLHPQDVECLTVIGDGPDRERLVAEASRLGVSHRVRFLGALPLTAVLEAYGTHDVLALPSESEGWPKVVVEAMACGLVAMATDRGHVRVLLGDGRGELLPPRDVGRWADALRALAASPDRRRRMGTAAAEWARGYSIEAFDAVLRRALSQWTDGS